MKVLNALPYVRFEDDQLEKIGNTIIYLAERIPNLSKTKLLKLLYILDEISIKKSGIPILNLKYKVWKLGPVSEELFIDLSIEQPTLLNGFIENINSEETYIKPKREFIDDEFSDNDIELMNWVIEQYGNKSANELIAYTHRPNAPWYNTAKEANVLELLENKIINHTDFFIDMTQLIAHDNRKLELYTDFLETH